MSYYVSNEKANDIRIGSYMVVKQHPCKVVEVNKSKTGKHGSGKIRFVCLDIFTKKKYEEFTPSQSNVEVPEVEKTEYQVESIRTPTAAEAHSRYDHEDDQEFEDHEKICVCKSKKGEVKEFPMPAGAFKEIGDKLMAALAEGKKPIVTAYSAMGKEAIVLVR
eukprot:TRINITY_DN1727_c0_g2_i1.p1 TRINITY_DN1727_c0_g2~~TRINITY_DN1727_c0_g2_i1.p1  ORF type:complete len:163 (-),score=56.19 TRINITY_DN1727_c0_g2_i1:84-572(-)